MRFFFIGVFICCTKLLTAQSVTTDSTCDGWWVRQGRDTVLFFQVRPQSINGKYERAPFIHPLYDAKGRILTENGPADHPYHRGIFWAWHQVRKEDAWVADGWVSENLLYEFISTRATVKKGKAVLKSTIHWIHPEKGKLVEEKATLVVHSKGKLYRQLDIFLHVRPLQSEVAIGGSDDHKGYGGFCMRWINPTMLRFSQQEKQILPTEAFLTNLPWMQFDIMPDQNSLSTILVLADNGRQTNSDKWVLRNSLSMQNNMFPGPVAINLPDEGLLLTYRLLIFNKPVKGLQGEKYYHQFLQENKLK
ncbi:DUF6807 family protein [Flavihumibacter sp. UBA7668]|uniref:DUF6807 family protein n=1 Tax=Flavihumibacter sp. UBA7668 TaxID=1946542 RepID=UPI0025C2FFD7|nr:DUF6807 family protein [Flavihumibacter sp. UBA7668]